jgi:hypothetical protein
MYAISSCTCAHAGSVLHVVQGEVDGVEQQGLFSVDMPACGPGNEPAADFRKSGQP